MVEIHCLAKLCRVCEEKLHRSKIKTAVVVYSCNKYTKQLLSTFMLDTSRDHADIHPAQFCNRCYSVIQRKENAAERDAHYSHSVVVFQWKEHSEGVCAVSVPKCITL